jgi:DUF4097 and DUF4098 domain-containing protein YvlB
MKRLLVVVAFLMIAAGAAADQLTETIDQAFDVKSGATVALTNVNGRITISSWDQAKVRVIARKKVEGDEDHLKAAIKEVKVDIKQRDGGLVITTRQPEGRDGWSQLFSWLAGDHIEAEVQYEVTVPRSMSVNVENTNGRIVAKDLSGKLEFETTNGGIEVANCSGLLDASTTNGAIEAELVNVTKGQPMRFETTNGHILVKLPATLGANVDADTTNGSIKSDLPIATTQFGRNSLRGTINGGGTQLRLRTVNGGISIQAAKPAA